MGNSKGIAVIALLIGASGLGLGAFSFLYFNNLNSITNTTITDGTKVQNTWYSEYLTPQTPSLLPTFATLTNMHLLISVNLGESVYISFNAKCTLYQSASYEYIQCTIFQNGIEMWNTFNISKLFGHLNVRFNSPTAEIEICFQTNCKDHFSKINRWSASSFISLLRYKRCQFI